MLGSFQDWGRIDPQVFTADLAGMFREFPLAVITKALPELKRRKYLPSLFEVEERLKFWDGLLFPPPRKPLKRFEGFADDDPFGEPDPPTPEAKARVQALLAKFKTDMAALNTIEADKPRRRMLGDRPPHNTPIEELMMTPEERAQLQVERDRGETPPAELEPAPGWYMEHLWGDR